MTAHLPPNRSIPDSDVIPILHYADLATSVEWLCAAFGFVERLRIGDHPAHLTVGSGAVVAADGGVAVSEPREHSIMVRVADADAHCARSRAQGARILQPPTDHPYGERQYTAVDVGGHVWTFTQTIDDVDPASWGGVLRQGGAAQD